MLNPLVRRIFSPGKFERVLAERLTEPLHVNIAAAFVALFGSFRRKVDFDLVIRPQYAFPILRAADLAREWGYTRLTILEFGVASGAGLLNICRIAENVTKATGITFRVVGFDTGTGMPPPIDYRDLPEIYQAGDFPMDVERLRNNLPINCELIIGDIAETLPRFLETVTADAPIGFASIDVDYYSSAKQALEIFRGSPDKYLPLLPIYLDDVGDITVNPWVGEALAVNEFNTENELRKIAPWTMLRARRLCKNAKWIDHIFGVHIHDHKIRTPGGRVGRRLTIDNEFIGVAFKDAPAGERPKAA
ncbi:hypothetical protein ASF27_05670 [Methylobacterium sp. Leaf102]|nr:hypothetical protein ASF27_05670 [Methylobacterium sp. Leaf102]